MTTLTENFPSLAHLAALSRPEQKAQIQTAIRVGEVSTSELSKLSEALSWPELPALLGQRFVTSDPARDRSVVTGRPPPKTSPVWGAAAMAKVTFGKQAATAPISKAERIDQLSKLSNDELDRLFAAAPSPTAIPSGHAVGTHVMPAHGTTDIPFLVDFVGRHFWKSKTFDAGSATLTDHVSVFPDTQARLYLGKIEDAEISAGQSSVKPYGGDGKTSVITDYTRAENFPVAVKWIDEFRQIEPGIWLGRSLYDGDFWAHVLLRFDD